MISIVKSENNATMHVIRMRLGKLRELIREVAATSSSIKRSVMLYEEGSEWHHFFILINEDELASSVESALQGGISIEKAFDKSGGWTVGSVAAQHGYGPLLYRLAMEYARENGGIGLAKNAGANTSPDAQRVWSQFAAMKLPSQTIDGKTYVVTDSDELAQLRSRTIDLTSEQADEAKTLVRNLWTSREDDE